MARIKRVAHLGSLVAVLALAIPAYAQNKPAIQIDNFGQVTTTYYRGAQPIGRDYDDLAALGIKTIINLTSDDATPDEPALAARAGMKYIQIPMTTHEPPTAAELERFLQIVNDPDSQPVYVHCVGGRHRTGVMTAAYRMTHDGWTGDRAFQEMKQYKFGADFLHSEFKSFVYGYSRPAAPAAASVAAGLPAPRAVDASGGTAASASANIRP